MEASTTLEAESRFKVSQEDIVYKIPLSLIRVYSKQPRKFFNPNEMEALTANISLLGQMQPGVVQNIPRDEHGHEFEIIDGERRYRACKAANIEFFLATIKETSGEEDQYALSAAANFNRSDHTDLEIIQMVGRFTRDLGWTRAEVATTIGKGHSWVQQRAQLAERLQSQTLELMSEDIPESRRLIFSSALLLLQVPTEQQFDVAKDIAPMKFQDAKSYIELMLGNREPVVKQGGRQAATTFNTFPVIVNLESEFSTVRGTSQEYEAGQRIYHSLDPAESVYIVERGVVLLLEESLSDEGHVQIGCVGLRGPGEVFGGLFGLNGYIEEARALVPAVAKVCPADEIPQDLLVQALRMQWLGSREARVLTGEGELSVRVARALVYLHRRYLRDLGGSILLSHETLAYITGSTRESVSKIVSALRVEGLIDTGYRDIKILQLEALEEIAALEIE